MNKYNKAFLSWEKYLDSLGGVHDLLHGQRRHLAGRLATQGNRNGVDDVLQKILLTNKEVENEMEAARQHVEKHWPGLHEEFMNDEIDTDGNVVEY